MQVLREKQYSKETQCLPACFKNIYDNSLLIFSNQIFSNQDTTSNFAYFRKEI